MVRKSRTHAALQVALPDSTEETTLAPRHLTKQEFGRRLYGLMLKKGWRQSELARQSGLPRDSISVYIRGKSLPTPHSVHKLAGALGVKVEDLLPNLIESAIDDDHPALEIKVSPNAPGKAWLRINQLVDVATAVRIADLLNHANDDAA